ncbi:stage II sporulation protein M [Anaerosacchariphilus polymeriproducens]|uniref:Stage II sporulation protein M n=1 Tax=Anaerosacchariphilus polymeriproducens TaxID=1812858 RepID=A0A371B0A8_9FIRM|nr:stage II sporulation protein M [Anaerosacchariphilus polymeriproducens]RDU25236.1 stage II sporulation protein M [Anaerosacchariphilus polymeriproducens]
MLRLKGKIEIPHKNLLLCIFSGGFLLGIIITNIFGKNYVEEMGILSDYFIQRYKYASISSDELFFYVLKRRAIVIAGIWAMGFSALGVFSVWLFIGWFGFSIGTLLTASIIRFGVGGILFSLGAIIPHYLIYVPVLSVLIGKVYCTCLKIYYPTKVMEYQNKKKIYLEYFATFLLISVVCIIGVLLESYVNPMIFKKVLRII